MNNSKTNKSTTSEFDLESFLGNDNSQRTNPDISIPNESNHQDKSDESTLASEQTLLDKQMRKTNSSKQRKSSLQEYQNTFLIVPKITDRKTVFISNELRERIVDIVRKLGTEKSSVSGFIENLVTCHLDEYKEDVESWEKL